MTAPFIHPLFDLSSPYRLASQESVWADRGERSIQRYFLALHRQMLREAWRKHGMGLQEEEPQGDWRFSERVNALLHEYHRRAYGEVIREPGRPPVTSTSEQEAVTAERELGAGENKFAPPPALLMFDLSRPGTPAPSPPYRGPDSPGWFTGIGDPVYDFDPEFQHDTFSISIPKQEDGRWCLALVLTLRLVRELARLLGRDCAWDEDQEQPALDTIREFLNSERLARPAASADPKQFQAAFQLAGVTALAAGWEQKVTDGHFGGEVSLGGTYPALQAGTWVVFCQGPRAADVEVSL